MREMTPNEQIDMQANILYHLNLAIGEEAAMKLVDAKVTNGETLMDAVMEDIKTSSDWEENGHYNDDDVRLAIGRVMMKQLHIDV